MRQDGFAYETLLWYILCINGIVMGDYLIVVLTDYPYVVM